MFQTTGSKLAVMVYHYLLERRMADLAEMFADRCLYLKEIKRSPYHCLLSNTPFHSLKGFLVEHETLLGDMKRIIQMYHEVVPMPFEGRSWDKIQFMVDYFYARGINNSGSNTVPESQNKLPCQLSTMNFAVDRYDGVLDQSENGAPQQAPLMQVEHPKGSPCTDTSQEINPTSSVAERSMVLYVANGSKEQINNDTVMIRMENTEDATNMQTDSVENIITMEDGDVAIGQQIEITTLIVEPVHASSALPSCPLLGDEDDAQQFANVSVDKENHEPLPMPTDNQSSAEQQNIAFVHDLELSETSSSTQTLDDTSVGEIPTTPSQEHKKITNKPIDTEALEEWKRIRSINNRNFDDHIRLVNRQFELLNNTIHRDEPKKTSTVKAKATPKSKSCNTALKPGKTAAHTKRTPHKQKVPNDPDQRQNVTPTCTERKKLSPSNGSDSSDFASSADDDEDVRAMSRRIRQYRKQQKHCQAKEKKPEASTGQSNGFASPSALPHCRVNLIVGRSPQSSVKKGLRNRTPTTSPAKHNNSVIDNTAVAATRRLGNIRTQRPMSGSKAQELTTDHQMAKSTSIAGKQSGPTQPGPVALSPKNRRPVRACTVNRKTIVASTPLKHRKPNVENVVSALMTPDRERESNPKPVAERKATTESIPETNNPETVDAGEAAIYAVLAQLHGDN